MSEFKVILPELPRALTIDFTDDLRMTLQQGDGKPLYVALGEQGMIALLLKASAAIDAYRAKQATQKRHAEN